MYDLSRFIKAQEHSFLTALSEIQSGRKVSHWMWYIFPQIAGLGNSDIAKYYEITNIEEAVEYLHNDTLCKNLLKISKALLALDTSDALKVMGYPDNLKLRSSMTLFKAASSIISNSGEQCAIDTSRFSVFRAVIDKYFSGKEDDKTLKILSSQQHR